MPSIDSALGMRFADAFLHKNWPEIATVLNPDVVFQGLTPGKAWDATSAGDLVDRVFSQWREPADDVYEVLDMSTDVVGDRNKVVYRFKIRKPSGDYICEETAYFDAEAGRITRLKILCSGYLPTDGRN